MKLVDEVLFGVLFDVGSYVWCWLVVVIFENNNLKDYKEIIGLLFVCMFVIWGGLLLKMYDGGCSDIDDSGGCGSWNSSG